MAPLPGRSDKNYKVESCRCSGVLRRGVAKQCDVQDVPINLFASQYRGQSLEAVLATIVMGSNKVRFCSDNLHWRRPLLHDEGAFRFLV